MKIVFIAKIFEKYILFGQLKYHRVNFEWSVPLSELLAISCLLHAQNMQRCTDTSDPGHFGPSKRRT